MAELENQPEHIDGSKGKIYDRAASIADSYSGTRVSPDEIEVQPSPGMEEAAQILLDAAKNMNRDWWKQ